MNLEDVKKHWRYASELSQTEWDTTVTKDNSNPGRWTIVRHMYFEPIGYKDWAGGNNWDTVTYSAELIYHPAIPAVGTHAPAPLEEFYVGEISEITNMADNSEHSTAISYGVVTMTYENRGVKNNSNSNTSSRKDESVKPWDEDISGFTITNREVQVPLVNCYMNDGVDLVPLVTTAGQPIEGFTSSFYTQSITWTYKTKDWERLMIYRPVINETNYDLIPGKVTIQANTGLLLPPTFKALYYTDDKGDTTKYYEWNFTIEVDPRGQYTPVVNAGTQFLDASGNLSDIFSYYTTDGATTEVSPKLFGGYNDVVQAKYNAMRLNAAIGEDRYSVDGEVVNTPIPLTVDGDIDDNAVYNPSARIVDNIYKYEKGNWNLGKRVGAYEI